MPFVGYTREGKTIFETVLRKQAEYRPSMAAGCDVRCCGHRFPGTWAPPSEAPRSSTGSVILSLVRTVYCAEPDRRTWFRRFQALCPVKQRSGGTYGRPVCRGYCLGQCPLRELTGARNLNSYARPSRFLFLLLGKWGAVWMKQKTLLLRYTLALVETTRMELERSTKKVQKRRHPVPEE
jgi:hypothetical protein